MSHRKERPLSEVDPVMAAERQARIDNSLNKYTERPEYPIKWLNHYSHALDILADSLLVLDRQIAEINEWLHKAQNPRAGKISVRFIKYGLANEDRKPAVVAWFGSDPAALVYKRVKRGESFVKARMRSTVNDKALRTALRHLEYLMERRRLVEETGANFSRAVQRISRGLVTDDRRTRKVVEDLAAQLERDYTKVT